jgi:hypothetical protein
MARSCCVAVTTGWQQLRLATALREADSQQPGGGPTYCSVLASAGANVPSYVVDCRRRFQRGADT